MDLMKYLIAVWGDPISWNEAEYKYEGSMKRGNSPAPILQEMENVDRSCIVLGNSLMVYTDLRGSFRQKELEEKIESYLYNSPKLDNLKGFFKDAYKIFVPVFGSFRTSNDPSVKVQREITLSSKFEYLIGALLSGFLSFFSDNYDDDMIVMLDLTHGMNYLNAAVDLVLQNVCAYLASVHKRVEYRMYASDPYAPGKVMNINQISSREFSNPSAAVHLFYSSSLLSSGESPWDKCSILTYLFRIGLIPQAALYSYANMIDIGTDQDCTFEEKEGYVNASCKFSCPAERVPLLLSCMLSRSKLNASKDGWMRTEDIKGILECFMPETQRIIGDKEYKELRHRANKIMKDGEVKIYKDLQSVNLDNGKDGDCAKRKTGELAIDWRNMVAHAGLEKCTTKIRKENRDIYVRGIVDINELAKETVNRIKGKK